MKSKTIRKIGSELIEVDGQVYEKVSSNSVELELDLGEDILQKLNGFINQGRYVSLGDAIRDILRTELRNLETNMTKTSTKKPSPKRPNKNPVKPPVKAPPKKPVKSPGRRSR